jgi:hypothetical protein
MAIDFTDPLGVDIACIDDLDASLSLVDGRTGLGQALARRISTARGMLFYDPTYGIDIRGQMNRPFTATQAARLVEGECIKDERVNDVAATVEFSDTTETLTITLQVDDGRGPFDLTISIDAVTVEVLNEGAT